MHQKHPPAKVAFETPGPEPLAVASASRRMMPAGARRRRIDVVDVDRVRILLGAVTGTVWPRERLPAMTGF
jgi:hypothetical protein